MDTRLKDLTDRIYQEGVTKGQSEAKQIVAEAQTEAQKLLAEAKQQALAIVTEAQKKADELRENTNSELKLASVQALESLKQDVASLVNGAITAPAVKAAMADQQFIQKAIATAIQNWAVRHNETIDMRVLVPENEEKAIVAHFQAVAKGVLDKGFSIQSAKGLKSGFQLAPADGSYKISFTDQDFINFFQEYLRPKVAEFLFANK